MNQVLLTLSVPPSQADILTDWLLERGFPGFTSWQAWGHSNRTEHLTISEQIQGKQKRGMISLHLQESEHGQVVKQLELEFQGFDIHYWVQPLLASGSFNRQGQHHASQ